MKLRNKKTGEIIEDECLAYIIQKLHDRGDVICRGPLLSMDLFAEYWEEIPERKPLINNSNIRRAVRAWAEASDIDQVAYDRINDCLYCVYRSVKIKSVLISFNDGRAFKELKHRKVYTIDELCRN